MSDAVTSNVCAGSRQLVRLYASCTQRCTQLSKAMSAGGASDNHHHVFVVVK